jgi:hypothetical protein
MYAIVLLRTAWSWSQKSRPLVDEKFAASTKAVEFCGLVPMNTAFWPCFWAATGIETSAIDPTRRTKTPNDHP